MSSLGDGAAAYLPEAYEQLRRLARNLMQAEPGGHTLQPTALVHEAFVKLATSSSADIKDATHFTAVAARAMRQVLVDHARARRAGKRGGIVRIDLTDGLAMATRDADLFLLVDQLLSELAALDPQKARVFEMSFLFGSTRAEIASKLGMEEASVKFALEFTRAWLRRRIAATERTDC